VEKLSVVAVVKMNGSEALVLNRQIRMTYEQDGRDYIGKDGPFSYVYKYEHGAGRFVAFAGRPVSIKMKDGEVKTLKDHWWHHVPSGVRSIPVCSIDELKKCYVFYTALIDDAGFKELRDQYTGDVFEYWQYEKMLRAEACGV